MLFHLVEFWAYMDLCSMKTLIETCWKQKHLKVKQEQTWIINEHITEGSWQMQVEDWSFNYNGWRNYRTVRPVIIFHSEKIIEVSVHLFLYVILYKNTFPSTKMQNKNNLVKYIFSQTKDYTAIISLILVISTEDNLFCIFEDNFTSHSVFFSKISVTLLKTFSAV